MQESGRKLTLYILTGIMGDNLPYDARDNGKYWKIPIFVTNLLTGLR